MSIPLDGDLFYGKDVPLRYDLLFDHTGTIPSFYFVCRQEMLIPERIERYSDLLRADLPNLGEFQIGEQLGFDGVLLPSELPFYTPEFGVWKLELPEDVFARHLGPEFLTLRRGQRSLSVLESVLELEQAPANSKGLRQLLVISSMCGWGSGGSSFWATMAPSLCNWIEAHPEYRAEAKAAMITAAKRLDARYFRGSKQYQDTTDYDFAVWGYESTRGIGFRVPGDATGLYVEESRPNDHSRGWQLVSSNVDNGVQQLELLAGLCTLARKHREHEAREASGR